MKEFILLLKSTKELTLNVRSGVKNAKRSRFFFECVHLCIARPSEIFVKFVLNVFTLLAFRQSVGHLDNL